MLKHLKDLWNLSIQLAELSTKIERTNRTTHDCLYKFDQFMLIARRLDEANPDRRDESDRVGAAALAKMLADDEVRRKQEGRS